MVRVTGWSVDGMSCVIGHLSATLSYPWWLQCMLVPFKNLLNLDSILMKAVRTDLLGGSAALRLFSTPGLSTVLYGA